MREPNERIRQQRSARRRREGEQWAKALGWLSIGLGLAELAAPDGVARLIGIGDEGENRAVLRGLGLREIASGVGILAQPRPAGWLWSRVAGDVMDLTLLGRALPSANGQRGRVAAAAAAAVGVTVLDLFCSRQLSRESGAICLRRSLAINRSPEELYRCWRDFENLPRFMGHLESVQVTGDNRSHWVAKGPAGTTVEWDAEIVEDRPNERIAWRSLPGAAVENAGTVTFEPLLAEPGAVVRVEMQYCTPAGRSLTLKSGQTHVQRYMRPLLNRIRNGEIDPSFVITHRMSLDDAPQGYAMFRNKEDGCIKVVMKA